MSRYLSMAPTWFETTEKIRKQGYVYIKTKKANDEYYIHKEPVSHSIWLSVLCYPEVIVRQRDYGKTFALTREELI